MSRSSKPNFVTKKSLKPLAREKPPAREKRAPGSSSRSDPRPPKIASFFEIRKFIASAIFFNSQAAEKVGLSLTDSQMIHTLQLYGPSTPTRLAAATGLSSGGVTVALDRLEKGGYIRREPNPADRRSLLIHINPARLLKLKGIYENVEAETRR